MKHKHILLNYLTGQTKQLYDQIVLLTTKLLELNINWVQLPVTPEGMGTHSLSVYIIALRDYVDRDLCRGSFFLSLGALSTWC